MAATRMPPPSSSRGAMAAGVVSPPYAQPAHQGTLAPGTRIMVGPIVVTVQKYLSQGGFAHVYLVTTDKPIPMPISATADPGATQSSTRGETLHVLKRMAVPDKEALASVRSEVEVHKSLRSHANIVHFIEASATALQGGGYEIFILMEYCSGGGIIDLMNARLRTRLSETEILKIFGDVAAGLSVMHGMSPPLMHRDLKVENILLAPPPRSNPGVGPTYKLCDFGSTKAVTSRRAPQTLEEVKAIEADLNKCTTLQYRAPEMVDVYQRRVIDEKADIWAMGVLLYKLCYYTTPFEENGGGPLAILNARYRFPQSPPYSQRLKDLIASMLQEHSDKRPSIDQVLLRVHHMLGSRPPASVLQKVQAASGGAASKDSIHSPARPSSSSNDLLQAVPSQADQRRAEAEEAKRRSEAITPMRRGRPVRETHAKPIPMDNGPSASLTSPVRSPPAASESLGFADSFSPLASGRVQQLATKAEEPPRPSSVLDHSPSLPGFDATSRINSARVSPLPPPIKALSPTAISHAKHIVGGEDDEARDRFPSVEELDKKYPIAEVKEQPRSSTKDIPGLSDRPSVSAMTDRFGSMAMKRASAPVATKTSPSIATTKKASTNLIGQRWQHDPAASPNVAQERSPPSLPSRKHDWLSRNGDTRVEPRKKFDEPAASLIDQLSDGQSSGDEEEGPEDLDKPDTVRSIAVTATQSGAKEGLSPPVLTGSNDQMPVRDVAAAETPISTAGGQDLLSSVSLDARVDKDTLASQSSAQAPAWDEDDEEMHFLPQPTIGTGTESNSQVDIAPTKPSAPKPKVYADASTSPIGNSPPSAQPEPARRSSIDRAQQHLPVVTRAQVPILSPKPSHLASTKGTLLERSNESDNSKSADAKRRPAAPAKPNSIRSRQDMFEAKNSSTASAAGTDPLPAATRRPQPKIALKPTFGTKEVDEANEVAPPGRDLPDKPLKPWEREAMEKERVNKYGSVRSQSPVKTDEGASSAADTTAPTRGKGEAQERFRGVSSLISQWQNNAARGAPGWGTVGGASSPDPDAQNRSARINSKDEDSLLRRTPLNAQGRLPSREV